MEKRGAIVLLLIVLLVALAAAAIVLDMQAWRGRQTKDMKVFQKGVGGLGMGAIATPIWNLIDYDPRIFSVEDCITWPVPGGYSYGPDRSATVSFLKEIPEDQWIILKP